MQSDSVHAAGSGTLLIAGTTIYALNAEGVNRFWASVYPGRTDGGERTSEAEVRAIARLFAAAPTMYGYIESRAAIDSEAAVILETIHASR